tara:strand:- start:1567 stop:2736 length:1170 start_codon:yes stop_codon:yes gene_type:complete
MKKYKIVFFTGNRAEYGLIRPFLKYFQKHNSFKTHLIVSGSHLNINHGNTIKEIQKDNIKNLHKININCGTNTLNKTCEYFNSLQKKINNFIKKNKTDIFFLSSDRFETMSAAVTAHMNKIPIIHYEGGDKTEGGTLDDCIRHSITKLAHLHLTSNKDSYRRVIKLGEEKSRVINIGYSAFIDLKKKELLNNNELIKKFKIQPKKNIILFTMHPLPLNLNQTKLEIDQITKALKKLDRKKFQIIATYPNFDPGYKIILNKLKNLSKNKVIQLFPSLGTKNYHSILNYIGSENKGICIGNSSSGIKEPVFFNCRSINIGNRQRNRIKPDNVIEINKIDANHIYRKILKVFKLNISKMKNPYALDSNLKDVSTKIIYFMKKKNFINKKCTY